ncbi:hypothetical protein HDU99_002742, partial [Rhizoclosmatium hyalinum]
MTGIDGHAVVSYESAVRNDPSSLTSLSNVDINNNLVGDSQSERSPSASGDSIHSETTDSSSTTHFSTEYAVWPPRENQNLISA